VDVGTGLVKSGLELGPGADGCELCGAANPPSLFIRDGPPAELPGPCSGFCGGSCDAAAKGVFPACAPNENCDGAAGVVDGALKPNGEGFDALVGCCGGGAASVGPPRDFGPKKLDAAGSKDGLVGGGAEGGAVGAGSFADGGVRVIVGMADEAPALALDGAVFMA
jgi:hypothetical protein